MIPTKEQCDLICERNSAFYRKDLVIDGYNVCVYNYRLASYQDFVNPTKAKDRAYRLNAQELRGLTFIQNEENWDRWLMLHKFFNINETIDYMYSDLVDKPITSVYDKLDGSLIAFVRLPNGKWAAKTKQVFDNEQAQLANKVLTADRKLQEFLDVMHQSHLMPLFELTSPDNRIVLYYPETKLRLIQVRDKDFGMYYDVQQFKDYGVDVVDYFADGSTITLDELVELQESEEGVEGWIVNYSGQLVKHKTKWYFELHRAKEQLLRSDKALLDLVLSDSLDDAMWLIDQNMPELRAEIEEKANKIRHYYNDRAKEIREMVDSYPGYETRRDFAIANKSHPYFHVVMKVIDGHDLDSVLDMSIRKRYNKEEDMKGLLK